MRTTFFKTCGVSIATLALGLSFLATPVMAGGAVRQAGFMAAVAGMAAAGMAAAAAGVAAEVAGTAATAATAADTEMATVTGLLPSA